MGAKDVTPASAIVTCYKLKLIKIQSPRCVIIHACLLFQAIAIASYMKVNVLTEVNMETRGGIIST